MATEAPLALPGLPLSSGFRLSSRFLQGSSAESAPIMIPVEKAIIGKLLGKGGENIKDIEAATGAKIMMDHSTEARGFSVCVVNSTQRAVAERAADMVRAKLVGKTHLADLPEGWQSFQIKVDKEFIPILVGKGGTVIRQIESSTKAIVELDHSTEPQGFIICTVAGPKEVATRATDLIRVRCKQVSEADGYITEEVKVEHRTTGHVLGKGGGTIRNIQSETGATLNFSKEKKLCDDIDILCIQGRPESVAAARKKVAVLIQKALTVEFNMEPWPDESTRVPVFEITVEKWCVGSILGKGMTTFKRLAELSGAGMVAIVGCYIKGTDDFAVLQFFGDHNCIDRAFNLIETKMVECFASEEMKARERGEVFLGKTMKRLPWKPGPDGFVPKALQPQQPMAAIVVPPPMQPLGPVQAQPIHVPPPVSRVKTDPEVGSTGNVGQSSLASIMVGAKVVTPSLNVAPHRESWSEYSLDGSCGSDVPAGCWSVVGAAREADWEKYFDFNDIGSCLSSNVLSSNVKYDVAEPMDYGDPADIPVAFRTRNALLQHLVPAAFIKR